MARNRILIVDDEEGVRFGIRSFLEASGYEVDEAPTLAAALERMAALPPDLAVVDYRLPDGTALALLAALAEAHLAVPVIMLTAYASIELAVEAMREGAEHFLTKPVELPTLAVVIERVLENQRNRAKQLAGRTGWAAREPDPFAGSSRAVRLLAAQAAKVVASDSPILIRGETGTGKGVLARWLHDHGPRAEEALVDLNCAGLSRELLESELFGHARGAFTGASANKPGLLEVAHRGTVFLDEIGDLDPAVQPKLLKVIEEKRFRRLGDVRDRSVDVRLVSATHWDLAGRVKEGSFRSDLYYRVAAIPLVLPALRERLEDLPALVEVLLERLRQELGRPEVRLTAEAMEALAGYPWPGNLRELRNVLERAILLAEGPSIGRRDLRFDLAAGAAVGSPETLREVEVEAIRRALETEGGRVSRAASRLGIPRSSLYQKMKRYGLARNLRFDANQ
jgi:DNA-binding NtrC family response regulator